MRVRDTSRLWVDEIKKNLLADPTKPVTVLAATLETDLPTDSLRENFRPHDHQLWTLGGNHCRTAIKELIQENQFPAENNQVFCLCNSVFLETLTLLICVSV